MNQEKYKSLDKVHFDVEFKDTLTFISEVCEVPNAFITHFDSTNTLSITEIGFESTTISEEIMLQNQNVINQNCVIKISDLKKNSKRQSKNATASAPEFCFFVGVPIVNAQNVAVGSICIVDLKPKELSNAQLRALEYAAKQISTSLALVEQNSTLWHTISEKERQNQIFIDNAKEIIYEIDPDGIYCYLSKNWTSFLGYEIEEALGKSITLFLHPDDLAMCLDHVHTLVETGICEQELVYRILHKNGHYVWHSTNIKFSEKDGKQLIIGSCRDITSYTETKKKLRQQKEFYEKILDQMPTDVAVFDQDHKYVYLNEAAIRDNELRKFIIGKDDFEYAKHTGRDDSGPKARRAKFLQVIESKSGIQWEERLTSPFTGLTSYHNRKIKPVYDDNGVFEMMVGFAVDVTESKRIQEEILVSKQLLNSILENIAVGILVQGPQAEIIESNNAACEMLGLTKEQLVGNTSFDTLWKAIHLDGSEFKTEDRPVPKAIASLKPVKNVVMGVHRPISMDMIWILVDAIPVFDDLGMLLYVICSFNDITELKITQDELKISNERFTYSSQATSDAIWDWNLINDEIFVAGSYQDLFGHKFKNNKCSAQECEYFIHEEDRLAYHATVDAAIDNINTTKWADEYRYLKSDGTYAYVNDKAIIIRDENGKALRMVGAMQDITDKKLLEDELKISNERFTYAGQATSDAIWDWNLTTNEIAVESSFTTLFGHYVNENTFLSSELESFIHPDDKEKCFFNLTNAIENNIMMHWSDEFRFLKSDGTYAYVNDKAVIIRDEEGEAVRMIGALQDVTNKKKLEDELKQSEAQFKGAFENSPVGMALVDIEGKYFEVNDRLCEIFGFSHQELIGLTFQEITYEEDLAQDLEYKRQLDAGLIAHFSSEKRFLTKNKAIIWTHMSVAKEISTKNEIYYICQFIDITERKKIEQQNKILLEENNRNRIIQLNEAKNMYRFLAENSVDLICLHNLDTSFQYISPSVVNILGYTPEEMAGKSPMDYVHPDDLQFMQDTYADYLDGKLHSGISTRFLTKKGNYIWLETIANVFKEQDVVTGFQSSSRDVTTRKKEEALVEKNLAKQRELNELRSNLVSTVSHEFRTPMTTIRTSAELISIYIEGQSFEKKPRLEKQLSTITGEIDRIVDLMNSVLTISKDDAGKTNFQPVQFDLKQLCLNVIETSFTNQMNECQVQTYFKGDHFLVFADKNLMKYSIFNLLNNAFKYSQGTGDVILKISASASKVKVKIIDHGIGIPAEDQDKLFNTFYRASNTDGIQGTGLGLYIVKTFTERNSGTVKLDSILGKGTTITLKFPLKK